MYRFGKLSRKRLESCHPKIQEIMNEVIKYIDVSIISGHRDEVEQNELVVKGYSQLKYPYSKHN